jgi:hypothetical protein
MAGSAPALDPSSFDDPVDRALAVLALAKQAGDPWLSAPAISEIFVGHGIRVHWKTLHTKLRAARELVGSRKRGGQWQFSILKKGEAQVSKALPSVVIVDPSNALQSTITLHGLLGGLKGDVRVCDPYLDHVSLEHLHACDPGSTIRLLTQTIRDEARVRRLLAAAKTEGRKIEIRQVATAALHDRYLIDDAGMTILGGSLNGFGKKQSLVLRVGDEIRSAMSKDFETRWSSLKPWS